MIDESRALVADGPHYNGSNLSTTVLERDLLAAEESSRLLRYLPGIFSDEPFLDGFLRIFESIWDPLDRQIDQLYAYFDPRLTPPDFLPWLGTWVDLVLDENWPEKRRRMLIRRTSDLYRRRGTAHALRDYLEIFTGVSPAILEESDDPIPFHFTVVFNVDQPGAIDEDRVRRIIEAEKPAHTTYTLRIEPRNAETRRDGDVATSQGGNGETRNPAAAITPGPIATIVEPPTLPPNGGDGKDDGQKTNGDANP